MQMPCKINAMIKDVFVLDFLDKNNFLIKKLFLIYLNNF